MLILKYLEPRRVEIVEVPRPTIDTGEVLIRTRACGICGTDVKTYVRGHPFIGAGAVLGHEISGVIAESRAAGWREGERVVVAPYAPCGNCPACAREQFTLCQDLFGAAVEPGGFSDYVRVPARIVQKGLLSLPSHLDFAVATLAEPIACCYHGLDALALRQGESLLILGDGPMGLLQAILARRLGASPIVLAGLTPHRLAFAARHADHIVNVARADLHHTVRTLTGGQGMDRVMVAVDRADVVESALVLVRRGGIVNFFAGLPGDARVNIYPNRIHYDEVTVVGTFGFAPSHFQRALATLSSVTDTFQSVITRTVTLEELEEAFVASAAYEGIKTVCVMPQG